MRPRPFLTAADANAAIAAAIAAGVATGGHVEHRFGGPGGRTVYFAHVTDGAAAWCLR